MNEQAFLQDDEVRLLSQYAADAQEAIAEIGCAFGGSTILLLAHCKNNVTVCSIDPFVQDSMVPFQATKDACVRNVTTALGWIGARAKREQWRLVQDFSYRLAETWDLPLDVLFIDGDHRYEAVRRDFDDWYRHVKTGGFVLLHDSRKIAGSPPDTFDRGWPGPTQLATELGLDPRVQLVDTAFSLSVFQKRGDRR